LCAQAYLPLSLWNLPRPGIELVSPALAGRFSTTELPGKPSKGDLRNLEEVRSPDIK